MQEWIGCGSAAPENTPQSAIPGIPLLPAPHQREINRSMKGEQRVHFIGIGGIGMSGIARILLQNGTLVSGSDAKDSDVTRMLTAAGAQVHIGHAAENVHGADEVVLSSAIRPDNPELLEAKRLGIPITHRAGKLASLLNSRRGITIAGTHGKTTTSSMTATLLVSAGLDPSYVVGGIINTYSDNASAGMSDWFVIEADESDGTIVRFHPEIAVLTNAELDHLDFYRGTDHLNETFATYLRNIKPGGTLVWCSDDLGATNVVSQVPEIKGMSYGLAAGAQITAHEIEPLHLGSRFRVSKDAVDLGQAELHVPGRHNVLNALAVVGVGLRVGLDWGSIQKGLATFQGVQRRFQIIGKREKMVIIDDYGHHPSEIKATLAAARACHSGRIIAVFQPHRYTRTQALAEDFGGAFADADEVILAEVYSAGEDPIPGVSSDLILQSMQRSGHRCARVIQGFDHIEEHLVQNARPEDMIMTIGAGDVYKIARAVAARLT